MKPISDAVIRSLVEQASFPEKRVRINVSGDKDPDSLADQILVTLSRGNSVFLAAMGAKANEKAAIGTSRAEEALGELWFLTRSHWTDEIGSPTSEGAEPPRVSVLNHQLVPVSGALLERLKEWGRTPETRHDMSVGSGTPSKKLGQSIAMSLSQGKEVTLCAVLAGANQQAVKGLIEAERYLSTSGMHILSHVSVKFDKGRVDESVPVIVRSLYTY